MTKNNLNKFYSKKAKQLGVNKHTANKVLKSWLSYKKGAAQ